MEAAPKELRRLPRLDVELTAERTEGSVQVIDRVLNLSVTGMLLLSQHELEPGAIVALKLGGTEAAGIPLSGAVVWSRPSTRWPGREAGLKLIGMSKEASEQLELLMMRLLASPRGRRSGARFNVAIAAQWRTAGLATTLPVELIDLSLGGAMIAGPSVPEYGDRGLLSLDFGEGVMATSANVVWRDVHRVPPAAGLSFDPGPEVSDFVAKVVKAVLLVPRSGDPKLDSLSALFDSWDATRSGR